MPIKCECTFLLPNLLITGLCNSPANCLLDIISFLIVPLEVDLSTGEAVFYQKIYKPLTQVYVDRYHILAFLAILNGLSHNAFSTAVLLFKSLKFP